MTPLLLDTHCWAWSALGLAGEFQRKSITAIEAASASGNLVVSSISVWELGMLYVKGRVTLPTPLRAWVNQALAAPGVSVAQLTPEIALESCQLPGTMHGDPADRILVATARVLDARLLTRDRRLLEYGRQRHARIVAA
jgi:PIN domain nuclease of toxin-antitoxin system